MNPNNPAPAPESNQPRFPRNHPVVFDAVGSLQHALDASPLPKHERLRHESTLNGLLLHLEQQQDAAVALSAKVRDLEQKLAGPLPAVSEGAP